MSCTIAHRASAGAARRRVSNIGPAYRLPRQQKLYREESVGRPTRGGPNPTLGIRDPDLFGYLGSGRWDPDLLINDPDPGEDPDPHEDPDPGVCSLDSLNKLSKLYNFISSQGIFPMV